MVELTTEQLIYLLHAYAYTERDTVTKGTVKSYLPEEWKEKAEEIYTGLEQQKLIKLTSKGRFLVTEQGERTLIANLAATNYQFTSIKGPKVLNTLLKCIGKAAEGCFDLNSSEKMTFDEFLFKFKTLYFEERKRQELTGVVAIHKQEILKSFQDANSATLSLEQLNVYFDKLKSSGKIFVSKGEKDELIHWVE
ncbi:hypothetical protein Cri9333_3421 [Crinalium epipsammum PCC 9333]|uniref:Uncharacterized protein n=1 Tax=Crinalium epipsammum PCC 9333 TaxID=1173022 RepID=K9W381_9CYAN|nr:hypothetical protein [Crinalium epipsammum]AFZ14249.1 hypothetical protein Cri9333_3421 [Crinalium epipsammum PCC 9333]